ncbi:MAG: hypothetical protein CMI30_11495 [Opitutae bacterium]|nr:hypothetical protein [Opitutae bacterium]
MLKRRKFGIMVVATGVLLIGLQMDKGYGKEITKRGVGMGLLLAGGRMVKKCTFEFIPMEFVKTKN